MLLATARGWPEGDGCALQPKWDGYRMLAAVDDGRVRCWTRHGTELTNAVGDDVLIELGELLPDATLVDGELVALASAPDGHVGQDFNRLGQTVFGRHNHALTFVVFDAPGWPVSSSPAGRGTSAAQRSRRSSPLAAGASA